MALIFRNEHLVYKLTLNASTEDSQWQRTDESNDEEVVPFKSAIVLDKKVIAKKLLQPAFSVVAVCVDRNEDTYYLCTLPEGISIYLCESKCFKRIMRDVTDNVPSSENSQFCCVSKHECGRFQVNLITPQMYSSATFSDLWDLAVAKHEDSEAKSENSNDASLSPAAKPSQEDMAVQTELSSRTEHGELDEVSGGQEILARSISADKSQVKKADHTVLSGFGTNKNSRGKSISITTAARDLRRSPTDAVAKSIVHDYMVGATTPSADVGERGLITAINENPLVVRQKPIVAGVDIFAAIPSDSASKVRVKTEPGSASKESGFANLITSSGSKRVVYALDDFTVTPSKSSNNSANSAKSSVIERWTPPYAIANSSSVHASGTTSSSSTGLLPRVKKSTPCKQNTSATTPSSGGAVRISASYSATSSSEKSSDKKRKQMEK